MKSSVLYIVRYAGRGSIDVELRDVVRLLSPSRAAVLVIRIGTRTEHPRGAQVAQYAFLGGAVAMFAASTSTKGLTYVGLVTAFALIAAGAGLYLARVARSWVPALWGLYLVLAAVGSVVRGAEHPRPPRELVWGFAAAQILIAVVAMLLIVRFVQRSKELERMVSLEATFLAFLATVIGVFTYALFEAWLDAPRLPMGVVWIFAVTCWIFFSSVIGRRYS